MFSIKHKIILFYSELIIIATILSLYEVTTFSLNYIFQITSLKKQVQEVRTSKLLQLQAQNDMLNEMNKALQHEIKVCTS